MNVILQTLLHDPILTTYFLGNGHPHHHDCQTPDCIGCAVAEAFADFNSTEKVDGFAALNLLVATWRGSAVCDRNIFIFKTHGGEADSPFRRPWQGITSKMHMNIAGRT